MSHLIFNNNVNFIKLSDQTLPVSDSVVFVPCYPFGVCAGKLYTGSNEDMLCLAFE